jgi:hypothetical protein
MEYMRIAFQEKNAYGDDERISNGSITEKLPA